MENKLHSPPYTTPGVLHPLRSHDELSLIQGLPQPIDTVSTLGLAAAQRPGILNARYGVDVAAAGARRSPRPALISSPTVTSSNPRERRPAMIAGSASAVWNRR